jgi:thiol:disulfide interchange protein DsbA
VSQSMRQSKCQSIRLLAAIVVLALGSSCSRAAEMKEGEDYLVIEPGAVATAAALSTAPADKSSKIVVTEFFSYQCPHCFAFSQPLRDWSSKLPSDVQLVRESVAIGHEPWVAIARSYYTLRSMGKLDALDEKIFNAIHQQGVRLDEVAYIMGWLNKNNVAPAEFDAAYRSQRVRDDFSHGEQLSVAYKIPSIPTMIVDGKYLVIVKSNVDFGQQLAVVDKLIARARSSRAR